MNKSYSQILNEAHIAGMAAGEDKIPTPMVVAQHEDVLDDNSPIKQSWFVPQGVCGFASVITSEHGNSKFVKYLKSIGEGDKYYYGGYYVKWVREFGQSYEKKVDYAKAFADVLNSYGIKAAIESRLD